MTDWQVLPLSVLKRQIFFVAKPGNSLKNDSDAKLNSAQFLGHTNRILKAFKCLVYFE